MFGSHRSHEKIKWSAFCWTFIIVSRLLFDNKVNYNHKLAIIFLVWNINTSKGTLWYTLLFYIKLSLIALFEVPWYDICCDLALYKKTELNWIQNSTSQKFVKHLNKNCTPEKGKKLSTSCEISRTLHLVKLNVIEVIDLRNM